MNKRSIKLAILAFFMIGSASAVLVDSFESSTGAWETIADGGVLTVTNAPTEAVTDGSYALMAAHTDAAGYVELAHISDSTSPAWWDTFRNSSNNIIRFDVYVEAEAIDANWAQVGLRLQGDGYDESFSVALTNRATNQMTVLIDYSSIDNTIIANATWGRAAIFFNAAPGSTRTPVYIDNFQVTTTESDEPPPDPEPEATSTVNGLSAHFENSTSLLVSYSRPESGTGTYAFETATSLLSNDWKTCPSDFVSAATPDSNGMQRVTVRMAATNRVGFIRLIISIGGSTNVVAVSPVELLWNGSFEEGGTDWDADGQHVITTDVAHSGNTSLQYVASDTTAGIQIIPVVGGRQYNVSGWIKTDSDFSGNAAIVLDCRDLDSNNLGFTTFGSTPPDTDWTNVTHTITVPTNAVLMKIVLKTYGNTGVCWFDDLSVLQTNGPIDAAIDAPGNPPLAGSWTATFEDNFDGSVIDGNKWKLGSYASFINGIAGTSADAFSVSNGALTIRATLEPVEFGGRHYDFSAGEITTMKRFRQKFGYFEARLRYKCVIGMFPAFWTMPDRGWYGNEDNNYKTLLKFDVSAFSSPVTNAQLHLTIDSVSSTNKELLNILPIIDDSWDESTVTWDNMPKENPVWLVHDADITRIAGDTLTYDLTKYINKQITGDKTVSLSICDTFNRAVQFTFPSREAVNPVVRPKLIIDGTELEPVADASVRGGNYTGSNYGSDALLTVKESWQRDNCSTYITTNGYGVVEQGMELDIFEDTGMSGTYEVHGGMHWDGYAWNHPKDGYYHTDTTFTVEEYHTYGMYWEEGLIEYYIDGHRMMSFETNRVCTASGYVFLSLQMGGWGINENPAYFDDRAYPADMDVDYVKVWSGTKQ